MHPAVGTDVNAAAYAEGNAVASKDQAKDVQYDNSEPLGYAFFCFQRRLVINFG